jgi:hypothetical protein
MPRCLAASTQFPQRNSTLPAARAERIYALSWCVFATVVEHQFDVALVNDGRPGYVDCGHQLPRAFDHDLRYDEAPVSIVLFPGREFRAAPRLDHGSNNNKGSPVVSGTVNMQLVGAHRICMRFPEPA